jgi:hypothetical protein
VTYVDNYVGPQPDADALSWASGELCRRARKFYEQWGTRSVGREIIVVSAARRRSMAPRGVVVRNLHQVQTAPSAGPFFCAKQDENPGTKGWLSGLRQRVA